MRELSSFACGKVAKRGPYRKEIKSQVVRELISVVGLWAE